MAVHTVTEAAKLAGVTRRTIYRYIKQGKLSSVVTDSNTTQIETSELLRVLAPCHNQKALKYPLDHRLKSLSMSHD